MNIRKIIWVGNSEAVIIPPQMMRELGLKRGDYFKVEMVDAKSLLLTAFDPATVPSRLQLKFEELRNEHATRTN